MALHSRYYSLDAFRGATVALMILVNNPGTWNYIYPPLQHAPWHGCTPTDLVFPFFLFAVGNAMAFVMPKLQTAGNAIFWIKLIKRTLLIFGIGLLLNWSPFFVWQEDALKPKTWENIRIMGVLQRIALCYFFASIIVYYGGYKKTIYISAIILLGYWGLTYWLGNHQAPYSLEGFWGTTIDRAILSPQHMYKGEGVAFDPEGLVGTIAATAQVLIGYLTGYAIIKKGKTPALLNHLALTGAVLAGIGLLWQLAFPFNKKIWTSSYVVFTSGLAISILNIMIFMIEFRGMKGGIARFFDVFGKNPLFIFVLSGLLPRFLGLIQIKVGETLAGVPLTTSPLGWFYRFMCKPVFPTEEAASFFYALLMLAFYWLIGYILDRKKIYIKV